MFRYRIYFLRRQVLPPPSFVIYIYIMYVSEGKSQKFEGGYDRGEPNIYMSNPFK